MARRPARLGASERLAQRCAGSGCPATRPTTSDTVAASLFGVAGLWTLGMGIDASILHQGGGQWISAAVVSLPAGLFYSLRLISSMRATAPTSQSRQPT